MTSGEQPPKGLSVSKLSHSYGSRRVLRNIELNVAPGEILCLLGPSGCGKTTALRLIAGLEVLQTGSIRWNGTVLADETLAIPPEQRGVSLLFQDFALFPHLTVAQNVAFGLADRPRPERSKRVKEVLAEVNMLDHLQRYPHMLSGGEQQRTALARARAPEPRIILLDEPFSSLDTMLRSQVRDQCFHILKETQAASMIVTHDAEEAMFMADKIVVMRNGEILQSGTPEILYFHPRSRFVAELFGELNEISGRMAQGHAETPIGRFLRPGIDEGTRVGVYIRPEAIKVVSGAQAAVQGKVLAARILGRSSLLHLAVEGGTSGSLHLHCRVPGRLLPPEGEIVGLSLDEDNVFVFPHEDRSAE